MSKTTNWPQLLAEYIEAGATRPFLWGEFDCCLFAAECIRLQTGLDLASPYYGRYSTALGSARIQRKLGSPEQLLDQHFERIPHNLIQRGDVVQLDSLEATYGVWFAGKAWSTSETGVQAVSDNLLVAWRVA